MAICQIWPQIVIRLPRLFTPRVTPLIRRWLQSKWCEYLLGKTEKESRVLQHWKCFPLIFWLTNWNLLQVKYVSYINFKINVFSETYEAIIHNFFRKLLYAPGRCTKFSIKFAYLYHTHMETHMITRRRSNTTMRLLSNTSKAKTRSSWKFDWVRLQCYILKTMAIHRSSQLKALRSHRLYIRNVSIKFNDWTEIICY